MIQLQERVCTYCGRGFPPTTDYFTRDRRDKSGLCARCKSCCKRIDAERRATGRKRNVERTPENIQRAAGYMLKHKNVRVKQLQGLKLHVGCQACGYVRCARSLHFHHKGDDKEYNIGQMAATSTLEQIIAETRKCVVLCGNCHGETHDGLVDVKPMRKIRRDTAELFLRNYKPYELTK